MVLRGSATHPNNLFAAYEATRMAELELKQIEEQLTNELRKKQGIQVLPEKSEADVTSADVTRAIDQLKQRQDKIDQLHRMVKTQGDVIRSHDQLEKTIKQFVAGGFAGMCSRTVVAPIDRVKILMQTEKVTSGGSAPKYTGTFQAIRAIVQEGGVSALWRSNTANIVRVAPYSASQFASYDLFKEYLTEHDPYRSNGFGVLERLTCGAMAAITATTVTHPLDVVRVRIATQPELKGMTHAMASILKEGGAMTFYKGYVPTVLSLTPFIAINFATFDYMKTTYMQHFKVKRVDTFSTLGMGAASGLFAQTICYPLDTVRRRMQLKGSTYSSTLNAIRTIMEVEGPAAFYLGMVPNALKIVPNNAVRFFIYSSLKDYIGLN